MIRESLPQEISPPEVVLGGHLLNSGADVVALPVLPGEDDALVLGPGAAELGDATGIDLLAAAEALRATAKVGEHVTVPVAGAGDLRAVVLVGVGRARPDDLRRAAAAAARACRGRDVVATTLAGLDAEHGIDAVTTGLILGSFQFSWRSGPAEFEPLGRAVLAVPEATDTDEAALARGVALGNASWRARTWATVPSNLKDPAWLVEQARGIAESTGLGIKVWDDAALRKEGFGGIVGVGQGSDSPPALVRLDYTPSGSTRRTPTVALVGKGITFDTGGYSLKPGASMTTMKRDMTGAAVVLSTLAALDAVQCPVRVVGLLPLAENAVSGSAMRPGDVLTHFGGRTTEVTNTDAEGRLVLADAMAYAVEEIEPDVLVDVATLTGGIKVGLGQQVGGLFANDDALAAALADAGRVGGEPLWRFPLHAGYEDKLASKVADANNSPAGPQPIMAALFLQHFAGSGAWAHLDVASVGDSPVDEFEYNQGPTGFGARALLTWLGGNDPFAGVRTRRKGR